MPRHSLVLRANSGQIESKRERPSAAAGLGAQPPRASLSASLIVLIT